MNPIIFEQSYQQNKNLPEPVLTQEGVSPESLKAAEYLLFEGEGCFAQKQKLILAEILDEIEFSSLIRSKLNKLGNKAGVKSLALQKLEKTARDMGWL